jgi:tetratricopeptide (TPR) repeat protein
MDQNAAASPTARGRLSTTPIEQLLVLALERRLSGSFVFETPASDRSALVVASGRVTKVRTAELVEPLGRLLTDSKLIDTATLERGLQLAHERHGRLGDVLVQLDVVQRSAIDRTLREQLARRLCWLGQLPEASAYGYYDSIDFLEDRPACGAEPLLSIWRCVRDGRGAQPRLEAALSALGTRPLSLSPRATLECFELSEAERAWVERLRARPLASHELLAHPELDYVRARRMLYALLITRQLEVGAVPSSAPRASSVPPAAASSHGGSGHPGERVEHALERASRLVRERTRAEGAAEGARAGEAARECLGRRQFPEAERLARKACEADPGNPEYLALHAWLRMQCGELAVPASAAQIVAALDRAAMKAPGSVSVRFQRAQVLKRLGRDEEAYKDFRFVARRNPAELDAVREVRLHEIRERNRQKQSGVFAKLFTK